MKPIRICVPVVAPTQAEAARAWEKIAHQGYLTELRVDYLEPPVDLAALFQDRPGPVIVTNRLRTEGGRWQGGEAARRRLLEEAITLGADYVDLEFTADPDWRRELLAHRGGSRIILSWHDVTSTPPADRLREVLEEMLAQDADIVKLVTFARQPADAVRLLTLIPAALERGREIIALGMGPEGKFSRVVAPLLGSYLTFATLKAGQESAPGQMTVAALLAAWEMLT